MAVPLRSLLLPKEHGSWSLAFEPVVLALLVAPSWAGASLAGAIAAGFLTRRPLKLAFTLPASDPRRRAAQPWALGGAGLALATLVGAALAGSWTALWPLLLAVPCGALFLWFDLRNAMREAEAELAGSIAFALTPAAFATVAGWPPGYALALAGLALLRNVTAVLTVRAYLRLRKGRPAFTGWALGANLAGLGFVIALAWQGRAPAAALLPVTAFVMRAGWLLGPWRPDWPASRIGLLDAALGALHVAVLSTAYAGFPVVPVP